MKRDVSSAIEADLLAAAAEKRRHFLPALVGAASLIVALLAMGGIRDDFSEMPLWRQIALAGSWIVCGLLFPAVGVGLWFPGRGTRVALASAGIVLPLSALLGWPLGHDEPHGAAPCGIALFVLGAGLVGIGGLSGAFAQRRSVASSAWVATGLTLSALATTPGYAQSTRAVTSPGATSCPASSSPGSPSSSGAGCTPASARSP